jgi:hypothetical protein
MRQAVLKAARRFRYRFDFAIIAFWVFALVPFFLENSAELFTDPQNGRSADYDVFKSVYKRSETLLHRAMRQVPSNVSLVTLSITAEGRYLTRNFCAARAFTARLIDQVAAAGPSAIVIDWANDVTTCEENDAGTAQLRAAVTRAARRQPPVPVITARSAWDDREFRSEHPDDFRKLPSGVLHDDLFIARPDVLDGTPAVFGSKRLDSDLRKVPLSWQIYDSFDAARDRKAPRPVDTLAVRAVELSNRREILQSRQFLSFKNSNMNPFVELFPMSEFPSTNAIDLICEERPTPRSDYVHCKPGSRTAAQAALLRSKIVLLADISSTSDIFQTPIGALPGAFLHASYIEGLLGGRFFKPVPFWLQIAVSLIWFLAIEVCFLCVDNPLLALFSALAVVSVFLLFFYYVITALTGYYFVLLPPSLLLILVRTCYALGERHWKRLEKTHDTTKRDFLDGYSDGPGRNPGTEYEAGV